MANGEQKMRKNKGEKVQHLLLQANLISLGKNSRLPGRTETQLVHSRTAETFKSLHLSWQGNIADFKME